MPDIKEKITVIIPAYNEAERIGAVISEASQYAGAIIVIDDGSQDETAQVAERAGAKVIRQANAGYIAAIKRGFSETTSEVVVTMDADGELPAEKILALVRPILSGQADMVQGHRCWIPRPSERVLSWLANRKAFVGDSGTGFRALRTDLARQLALKGICICGIFSLEVISKGGRIAETPIELRHTNKPRRIAWFHVRQFFYLLPWFFHSYGPTG